MFEVQSWYIPRFLFVLVSEVAGLLFSATTVNGLTDELRLAVRVMNATDYSTASITSASELFMRFISLASLEQPVRMWCWSVQSHHSLWLSLQSFGECKAVLLERGKQFIPRVSSSKQKIVAYSEPFIRENCVSRSVLQCSVLAQFSLHHRTWAAGSAERGWKCLLRG